MGAERTGVERSDRPPPEPADYVDVNMAWWNSVVGAHAASRVYGLDLYRGFAWTVEFNHGLGEIMTALIDHGMSITAFEEMQPRRGSTRSTSRGAPAERHRSTGG
jgi:hypothetical protein